MAALKEPCYLCVGGVEIANSARARAYVATVGGNSCGLGCGTQWPTHTCTPPGAVYTNPGDDDAAYGDVWWWDPSQPGYDQIIGVVGTELSVSHGLRTGVGVASWGGFAGPNRYGPITVQFSGVVHTRSKQGTAAAQAMLLPALMGGVCGSSCTPPDLRFYESCGCDGSDPELRTLKGAQLIAQDFEIDDEYPRDCGLKFTATFQTVSPYVWWPNVEWLVEQQTIRGHQCSFVCDNCPETSDTPCTCGCLASLPLPSRILNNVGCVTCDPFVINRTCVEIVPPSLWNTAAVIIEVYAGSNELSNLRIRGWQNPLHHPVPVGTANDFKCETPCIDLSIGCVPARGTLIVDGSMRDALIRCVDGTERGALQTLSSSGRGIRWPDVGGCSPIMFCVDADALRTADDAWVSIGVQQAALT